MFVWLWVFDVIFFTGFVSHEGKRFLPWFRIKTASFKQHLNTHYRTHNTHTHLTCRSNTWLCCCCWWRWWRWSGSDWTLGIMGSSLSEPCIYDKLSESIEILRQSGYRYGMSEREIEKFIKQVLETNEPRREPPQFPVLRAAVKV